MKVYLVCSLNDKDYMDPEFEFFKYFEDAHRCIKVWAVLNPGL